MPSTNSVLFFNFVPSRFISSIHSKSFSTAACEPFGTIQKLTLSMTFLLASSTRTSVTVVFHDSRFGNIASRCFLNCENECVP